VCVLRTTLTGESIQAPIALTGRRRSLCCVDRSRVLGPSVHQSCGGADVLQLGDRRADWAVCAASWRSGQPLSAAYTITFGLVVIGRSAHLDRCCGRAGGPGRETPSPVRSRRPSESAHLPTRLGEGTGRDVRRRLTSESLTARGGQLPPRPQTTVTTTAVEWAAGPAPYREPRPSCRSRPAPLPQASLPMLAPRTTAFSPSSAISLTAQVPASLMVSRTRHRLRRADDQGVGLDPNVQTPPLIDDLAV